jgi:glutamyl-tRNA synthetase
MRFQNEDLDDLVILRTDGSPIYNLAVVSDDAEQGITHVVRGDDHLSNTPKQILLYEALGLPVPRFGHVPMILGPDGKRLSKRHGATAVGDYAGQGFLPEAMVNFLALLGWNPGDEREVMSRDELVEAFSIDRVQKKSAVFNTSKLEWLNGQYLASLPTAVAADLLVPRLEDLGVDAEAWNADREAFLALVDLLKVRARTTVEMADQALPFVRADLEGYEEEAVARHWAKDPEGVVHRLRRLHEALRDVPWSEEDLEAAIRGLAADLGVGAGKVIHPLRLAVTGRGNSPGIFEVLLLLGREKTLKRLENAWEHLSHGDPEFA